MKILFVSDSIPRFGHDGASHRSKQMLQGLQAFGTVDVAVLPWGKHYTQEDFAEIETTGRLVFKMPVEVRQTIHLGGLQLHELASLQGGLGEQIFTKVQKLFLHRRISRLSKAFEETVRPRAYDLVFVRYYRTARWLALEPKNVILDLDDCELESLKSEIRSKNLKTSQRLLSVLKYASMRRTYLRNLSKYRRVLFAGNWSRHYKGSNALAYPNLYPVPGDRKPERGGKDPRKVIFIGSLNYAPNLQAVKYLIQQLCPLLAEQAPELEVVIYGSGSLGRLSAEVLPQNLRLFGFVRDIGEAYEGALCSLVPTCSGGGTHIKVLESIAHKVPIVGTPFAFRGFEHAFNPGKHFLRASNETEFVEAILGLQAAPEMRQSLCQKAYDSLLRHYGMQRNHELMRVALDD